MAKRFRISGTVIAKLQEKHSVSRAEVIECFYNKVGPSFRDTRAEHQTDPVTQWFVAETDCQRVLKVVYIEYEDFFVIRTAYEPRDGSDDLYKKLCASLRK
jgi:hypothetical protein